MKRICLIALFSIVFATTSFAKDNKPISKNTNIKSTEITIRLSVQKGMYFFNESSIVYLPSEYFIGSSEGSTTIKQLYAEGWKIKYITQADSSFNNFYIFFER